MSTYSRDDVIEIQEASYRRGLEANKEYIAKLEIAVQASLAWLDKFGEHAPLAFGGEQELHDTLQAALAAQPLRAVDGGDAGESESDGE